MDESKKPSMEKLTQKIWHRYQQGSHRLGIEPQSDLEACINASLTDCFDYQSYLNELISINVLMNLPRDQAMYLIEFVIRTTLQRRIARAHTLT